MTLFQAHIRHHSATAAVVAALCLAPITTQANPWNPYPQQTAPVPAPAPAPKPLPKYYEEAPAMPPATQAAPAGPSRFAPPDLDRQLSMPPQSAPYVAPYGYQGAPLTPYASPPAYNGPPPVGYAPAYPMGTPPYGGGYGGYPPPPFGNNFWGGPSGNNYSPFGFW